MHFFIAGACVTASFFIAGGGAWALLSMLEGTVGCGGREASFSERILFGILSFVMFSMVFGILLSLSHYPV